MEKKTGVFLHKNVLRGLTVSLKTRSCSSAYSSPIPKQNNFCIEKHQHWPRFSNFAKTMEKQGCCRKRFRQARRAGGGGPLGDACFVGPSLAFSR